MKTISQNKGRYWAICLLLMLTVLCSSGCVSKFNKSPKYQESIVAFERNKLLGKGVNLGNALEAPMEGAWGVVLREQYFQLIKDAGFDSVRIPVRWSAHALAEDPYTIDPIFFDRVDWAVNNALSRGLCVIINIQNYEELNKTPIEHKQRYLSFWKQISEHYKGYPDGLLFEFLNEPAGNFTSELWNQFIIDTLSIVRQSNPTRTIVVGPYHFYNIEYLHTLKLPDNDRNIIVAYHYYNPYRFTHQGTPWSGEKAKGWVGIKWTGKINEKQAVIRDFNNVLAWAMKNRRPISMGEFGTYEKADMDSRVLWTDFVARQAEKKGFSWGYWEFCSSFGIYDDSVNDWRYPLLEALIVPQNNKK